MSSLANRQADFMRAILDEDAPLPDGWGNSQAAGIAVYRGNYRHSLIRAMETTFERTRAYVGEAAFARVAAQHLIANPPSGWTIDAAGTGFELTCAERFGDNREVAELAWIEWRMLELATAPDCTALNAEGFTRVTAEFSDEQWLGLRLQFQPRAAAREMAYDLMPLWHALSEEGSDRPALKADGTHGCLVWREGERPIFTTVDPANARAFAAMQAGASFGEVIVMLAGDNPGEDAVRIVATKAGEWLGNWVKQGMVIAIA